MEDIFGLLILVMPLPVFGLIGIGFLAIVLLVHKFKKTGRRWAAGLLAGLAFLLIFTWDVIMGNFYFYYLCATEGGGKVYQQAELPSEYWRDSGIPRDRLEKVPGEDRQILIGDKYILERNTIKNYGYPFRIDKEYKALKNRIDGEVLSEFIHFRYWGGWLINATALHRSADHCPNIRLISKLYSDTFVKAD